MPDTPRDKAIWSEAYHKGYETGYAKGLAHIDALTAAPLDLARLREALDLCGIGFIDGHLASEWADALAAEYNRLAGEASDG